ncbi:hypothetical protein [Neptunitalea lumnitzerae]|uniref:Uncharacterized protein n=1 Tax=Neptunitalea lumnitzerae TaxID=2965509 RepID=A0ABQ5MLM5_9FLAO|nr:hypothetical protein [Neptunitalea sp. Y10]GLB50257.1 hypothetical protein Y10_26250 [Neptunitalea sp. Y10]
MDELEFLKKDWQRKALTLPKLSYDQIHQMIWRKSSSIVKWIFYISIIEFVFWLVIAISAKFTDVLNADRVELIEEIFHVFIIQAITFVYYAGLIVFIYFFFLNYKRISTIDNVKTLLKNILRTRRTVNYYVWFNLGYFALVSIITLSILINQNADMVNLHQEFTEQGREMTFYMAFYGVTILFIALFGFVIWLFYKLLYGILLGKLKRNYKELKKIDL